MTAAARIRHRTEIVEKSVASCLAGERNAPHRDIRHAIARLDCVWRVGSHLILDYPHGGFFQSVVDFLRGLGRCSQGQHIHGLDLLLNLGQRPNGILGAQTLKKARNETCNILYGHLEMYSSVPIKDVGRHGPTAVGKRVNSGEEHGWNDSPMGPQRVIDRSGTNDVLGIFRAQMSR